MAMPGTVSQKCNYALRAIFELALRNTAEPVKTQDIASAQLIPCRFLEVILAELKHGGFVESKRGSDGGYVLARPADNLTVGDVISFLQGRPHKRVRPRWQPAEVMGDYAFTRLWQQVGSALSAVYNATTFADLVEEELARKWGYVPDYSI